jgi:hypothetical protein
METSSSRFGLLQVLIVLLALATAVIHLSLNFPDVMFILNGLGYIALVAALFLPLPFFIQRRGLIRNVLIGYTALTIILWVVMGARTPIGYIDKAIEVVLIVLLFLDKKKDSH